MNGPDNTDLDISLKIIPAPIRMINIPVHKDNSCDVLYSMMAPLPVTETDTGDDMDYLFSGATEDEDYIDIQSSLKAIRNPWKNYRAVPGIRTGCLSFWLYNE